MQSVGRAEVTDVFKSDKSNKTDKTAACRVVEGVINQHAPISLLRGNVVIHEGNVKAIKRFKDEVKLVEKGYECGIMLVNYNDIKIGDIIECYE